jgi:Plasmid pRiA4b ORF-3-like protein/Helix-turn-helix domain
MAKALRIPELLTDAQVEEIVRQMQLLFPPGVGEMLAQYGIDPRDGIRFHAVAARCRAARERHGHTVKAAAQALKVPQYRLKDIEESRPKHVDAQVLTRYVALLGLERWFARWRAHSPALAARLGLTAPGRRRAAAGGDGERSATRRAAGGEERRATRRSAPGAEAGARRRSAPDAHEVLQFRIDLQEVTPPVWRRIEVPARYTFWDLHVAIQDAMGWTDSHLHVFELIDPVTKRPVQIGIPDEDLVEEQLTHPGWQVPIAPYFAVARTRAEYLYDFGDDWHHTVVFEGARPQEARVHYPRCAAGANACPPEDVGGPPGYEEFLTVIADPDHEEHDAMLQWAGGAFDPGRFSPAGVCFDDPRERWRMAFAER